MRTEHLEIDRPRRACLDSLAALPDATACAGTQFLLRRVTAAKPSLCSIAPTSSKDGKSAICSAGSLCSAGDELWLSLGSWGILKLLSRTTEHYHESTSSQTKECNPRPSQVPTRKNPAIVTIHLASGHCQIFIQDMQIDDLSTINEVNNTLCRVSRINTHTTPYSYHRNTQYNQPQESYSDSQQCWPSSGTAARNQICHQREST